MTVTMKNGDEFTLNVTDAQITKSVITAGGDTYEIKVTYNDMAGIPDGADLLVKEITENDEKYSQLYEIADNALLQENEEGLKKHAMFDISIVYEGKKIEPAEGSLVAVEIKLVPDVLITDGETADDENTELLTSIDDSSAKEDSFIIYQGQTEKAIADGTASPDCNIVHVADSGTVEVISDVMSSSDEDDRLVLDFVTDSFSAYIVATDDKNHGDQYTYNNLPTTAYVGDTYYIYENTAYIYDPNNITSIEYPIDNDTTTCVVINLEKTGTFWIGNKQITVSSERTGTTPPDTVSTVSNDEIGLTLNMFDYDLDDTLDSYFNEFNLTTEAYLDTYINDGINYNHAFKFWGSGVGNWDANSGNPTNVNLTYNGYNPGATTDIVDDELSGGYPALSGGEETLAYLFNLTESSDKKVYADVDGLFQKDENDYYYYDSNKNYAWLDTDIDPSTEGYKFEVYDGTYTQKSNSDITAEGGVDNGKAIGFFPFHKWDDEHDLFVNWNKHLNHHFGLSMSMQFSLPKNPKAAVDKNGNDIVFEFSGDDDMWVFIDGKLAMDIGGIHQPDAGSINFNDQTVVVGGETQSGFDFSNLYDGELHTIQVFYLERGGCDSNCKIKFNLTRYAPFEFDKVDEENPGTYLEGAKFALYKDAACTIPLMQYIKNSNYASGVTQEIFTAEADENGHVKFEQVPLGTYYMKEIKAPDGYVSETSSRIVELKLDENGTTYTISGEDADASADGVQIPDTPKKELNLSLTKQWYDNGITTPPTGAEVIFVLKRVREIVTEETTVPEKTAVTVRLVDASGTEITRKSNVYAGDTIGTNTGFAIKTTGVTNWSANPVYGEVTEYVNVNGTNVGSLTTRNNYHWTQSGHVITPNTTNSTSTVSYVVNTADADDGVITMQLDTLDTSDFDTLPSLTVTRNNLPLTQITTYTITDVVDGSEFTLPEDNSWYKSFTVNNYDEDGNRCSYYFEEVSRNDAASAYTIVTYENTGDEDNPLDDDADAVVTNKAPDMPRINASKVWQNSAGTTLDDADLSGYQVELTLYKNGSEATAADTKSPVVQTVSANGTAEWILTSEDTSGYTVVETGVRLPGETEFADVTTTNEYGGVVTGDVSSGFIVTNTVPNASISVTKEWQNIDGTDAGWLADVTFKLRKKTVTTTDDTETVTYSDVSKPEYYTDNGINWSQTITTTTDSRTASWDNLDTLDDNESYVAIESEIAGATDVTYDEASGAVKSFKLNGKLYSATNSEISGSSGTTINKEQELTDITVQKVWDTPEGLSAGSATMVLYQITGTKDEELEEGEIDPAKPSDKIYVNIDASLVSSEGDAAATTSSAYIDISYDGTSTGSYRLSNENGWSHTFALDRGGTYNFAYEADGTRVLSVTPEESSDIESTTTIPLTATVADIPQYTYAFTVSSDERPTKGSITVTCNGEEAVANADNNWTVEFPVADEDEVTYSAEPDNTFITAVTLDPAASDGEVATGNKAVELHPTAVPLTFTVPISVDWGSDTPDDSTVVTVTFSNGDTSVSVTLDGTEAMAWSDDVTLQRLDDEGNLLTWTVSTNVTSDDDSASVSGAPTSVSDSDGDGEGDAVALTGTVSKGMNLTITVPSESTANLGELFTLNASRDTSSYTKISDIGWKSGPASMPFSDLALTDSNGDAIYYCFRIYSNNKVTTNASDAGLDTIWWSNYYVYVKAQSGDVTVNLESADSLYILTNQMMSTLSRSVTSRTLMSKRLFSSGNTTLTPSETQTFYDPSSGEGDTAFTAIRFKDLPEGATVVSTDGNNQSGTQVITGDASFTWTDLPTSDEDGNPIYYYVVETDATAQADTMTVKYEYTYNDDGTISTVTITNTTTGTPSPSTGDIVVTKTFSDTSLIPDGFTITNDYDDQEFTIANATGTDPYTWTLSGVTEGTLVTFTESGATVNGYNLTVTANGTVTADSTVSATATAGEAVTASLINTYEPMTIDITLKKVDKYDVDKDPLEAEDLLNGASFILEKYNQIAPVESKDVTWNTAHADVNTGTNGVFSFEDLPAGIYKIIEKAYPEDHVQSESDPVFEITVDDTTGGLKIELLDSAGGLVRLDDDGLTLIVGNEPGYELPEAGGPGTLPFTALGSILILFASLMLIRNKKAA